MANISLKKERLDNYDLIVRDTGKVVRTTKLSSGEALRMNNAFQLNRANKLYVLSNK